MPFDSLSPGREAEMREILDRLERLQKVAADHRGDESTYWSCLWSEVRSRPFEFRLVVAGYDCGAGHPPSDPDGAADLFGLYATIWGKRAIEGKRQMIAERIAELKAQLGEC